MSAEGSVREPGSGLRVRTPGRQGARRQRRGFLSMVRLSREDADDAEDPRDLSRPRYRHLLGEGAADRRRSAGRGGSLRPLERPAPPPAMERAGPGGLVPGGRGGGFGDPPPCARRIRSARRRRPLGPDAWRDPARRRRQAAEARHPLERRPLFRRMRRTQAPRSRSREAHRQPRHARLHRAENAVGRRARAGHRQGDKARAAAQGLRAPAPLGRRGLGNVGRVGHALARRRPAAVGRGPARGDRAFAQSHAEAGRGLGSLGLSLFRDRDNLGPHRAQDSDRGRGRRQRGLGHRRRRDRARRGLRVAWNLGRRLLRHRPLRQPARAHAARILPCAAEAMARHVGHAVGGVVAVVDRRRSRPRARHRRTRRRAPKPSPIRRTRSPPRQSSCPISAASGRPTTTRRRRACSPA